MAHPRRPEKPCLECGKLFWTVCKKTERCSLECARTYRKRRTRERTEKPCGRCREVFPMDEFLPQNPRRENPKPRSYCSNCARARKQNWAKVDLKRRFHLSVDDYEAMLRAQGGGCAMCQRPPLEGKRLHVDHDHACCSDYAETCGKCVRGLLCSNCNTALGHLRDDVETLRRGIMYLTNPPAETCVERGFADAIG